MSEPFDIVSELFDLLSEPFHELIYVYFYCDYADEESAERFA